ncbi:MAG: hypothetical protein GTN74_01210 [Proteobacteria bacterium]|nr:hypothetical protein [Pseudomonadota bacterium]NIS67712.1 hypothetical protein [Pseudomonadota bacterium]
MEVTAKNQERKRRYKVYFIKEGEPKMRHLEYVWARSATEAEQVTMEKRKKLGEGIIKIKAGVLR